MVVRTVDRADPADVDALGALGTATVHEAIGRRGSPACTSGPSNQGARLAGPSTVSSHPGDNLMIHAAVEVCRAGDAGGHQHRPRRMDVRRLLATSLMARGVRALVIDAGVRDTAELREMGFAVWAQHVSCQGTVKASARSVNVPVVLGGAVAPGDVVAPTTTAWWSCPSRAALGARRARGG